MGTALALWRVTERFHPDQPRDSHGRWSDASLDLDELDRFYGQPVDEAQFGDDGYVTVYPSGLTINFDEGDERFSIVAEDITPAAARALADTVAELLDQAPGVGEDEPDAGPNGLVDWVVRDGFLVGLYPDGDIKVGADAGGGRFNDFDLDPNEAYQFLSGLRRMAAVAEKASESAGGGMSTALSLWRTAERFDPHQPRDLDGQWTDGTPSVLPKAIDKLKLGDRIQLAAGERLAYSGKVESDTGTVRMAVTEGPSGKSVRLGVGGAGFGSRADAKETGLPIWSGNPTEADLDRINDERTDLRVERDELEHELDHEDPSPERRREIERRLDEIDDADTNEVYRTGATTKLDHAAASALHDSLDAAVTEADRQIQAAEELDLEIDGLLAEQYKLAQIIERKWTDEEDARWDSLGEQIDALRAEQDAVGSGNRNGYIVGEGVVSGEWGDLLWDVELDDHSVGAIVRLGVRPHDEPGWSISTSGGEDHATFDARQAWTLVHQLGERMDIPDRDVESACPALALWRTAERFNPDQPRDHDGQWTDGVPGPASVGAADKLKLAGRIGLSPGERLAATDKVDFKDGTVRLAVTDGPGGRVARIGIGGRGFGSRARSRETHEPIWDAGPGLASGDMARMNAERAGYVQEEARLSGEWPTATGDRREEIERRLEELDNLDGEEVRRSGGTARLDAEAVAVLRRDIDAAMAEAARRDVELEELSKHAPDGTPVDEIQRQYNADNGHDTDEYHIVKRGTVYGEWGDIAYQAEMELGSGYGPRLRLGVRPKGDPDWSLDSGDEDYASLDLAETRRLLRMLGRHMESARESIHSGGAMTTALDLWRATEGRRKSFDPHQPRDADGQWVDGPGGSAGQKVAAAGIGHVAHLEGLGSREEAHAYLAGIKGAELEELRKATGVKRGTAAAVRQRIADQTTGSKSDTRGILGTGGTDFGWGDAGWNRGDNAFTPSSMPAPPAAKKAPAARAKASGKSTDEHLSALSGMDREQAAAHVAGLPGKELDAILARMPTASRGRTLADKRTAVVVGSVGFKAAAKAISGTDSGVLSGGGAGTLGGDGLKFGSWADDPRPKKRVPRKKTAS